MQLGILRELHGSDSGLLHRVHEETLLRSRSLGMAQVHGRVASARLL